MGGRSVETAGSASGEDDNDDDDEESDGEAPAVLPAAEDMAEEKKAESEPVVATPPAGRPWWRTRCATLSGPRASLI